jgi:hypothetical protein
VFSDLPYPCYVDDGSEQIKFTNKKLIEDEELQRILNKENGVKLVWINYFKEIQDVNNSMSGPDSQVKLYKGQWRANDMNVWEGFGIVKFPDGSNY